MTAMPSPCAQCGRPVEPEREVYATPTCLTCLPPPEPLPVALPPSMVVDQILARTLASRPTYLPSTQVDPNSDAFLASFEWRRLRYKALTIYGRRCMCCGATEGKLVVDHIKSRRLRPDLALHLGNLQVLCDACNHGKAADDETDFRTPAQKAQVKEP